MTTDMTATTNLLFSIFDRFYRAITEDCWPCTKCCPNSTIDDHEPQCLSQGLPAKQTCPLDFKTEACATAKPAAKPTTIITQPASHRNCQSEGVVNSTIVVVHYYHTTANSPLWMGVSIGMLVIFAVGIPLLLFIRRPRFNNYSISYRKYLLPGILFFFSL